jgi:hypothetical protein
MSNNSRGGTIFDEAVSRGQQMVLDSGVLRLLRCRHAKVALVVVPTQADDGRLVEIAWCARCGSRQHGRGSQWLRPTMVSHVDVSVRKFKKAH